MTESTYCLYARKSSESDERQALSIDSQITEMTRLAEKEGIPIIETIRESKSAKNSGYRSGYEQLLDGISKQRFNSIITWAPDRLSRNAGDLGRLVDLMDQKMLVKIQTHGQSFTNTPDEKFLLMILCSQAKLENDNRGKNVKRGLRTRCEMGVRPGCVPLGYKLIRSENFKESSKTVIDEERAPHIQNMFKYVATGNISGRQAWEYMADEGLRTKNGKKATLSMVFRMLKEPFYYGRFEYPRGSGNWYDGSHEPLIDKTTFDKVQKAIKTNVKKEKWGRKNFYFNKIFKCGSCGSGISGESHVNRHGKTYTYYKCNRYGRKGSCKEKYIREEKIIEALVEMVHSVSQDSVHLSRKLEQEVNKLNEWEIRRYGDKAKIMTAHEYLAFMLETGNTQEKSNVLRCLKGQLVLQMGAVRLKEDLATHPLS